jgi:hypothetical protein
VLPAESSHLPWKEFQSRVVYGSSQYSKSKDKIKLQRLLHLMYEQKRLAMQNKLGKLYALDWELEPGQPQPQVWAWARLESR